MHVLPDKDNMACSVESAISSGASYVRTQGNASTRVLPPNHRVIFAAWRSAEMALGGRSLHPLKRRLRHAVIVVASTVFEVDD
jgi:hypothetical protein